MSFKGKKNIYKCDAGHLTVTIDRDEGVTPFLIRCTAENCSNYARSKMYHEQCQVFDPSHEWYSPDEEQKKKLSEGELDHVSHSGLLLRRITNG